MEKNRKYGKLTTLERVERRTYKPYRAAKWLCRCDCGNEKIIDERNLYSKNSTSCGCSWFDKTHIYESKGYLEKMKNALLKKSKITTSNCWSWQGAKHKQGYGNISFKGKCELAHRVSWIVFKGEIPKGIKVCHKCDVTSCCNPEHLFLGTQKDNVLDARNKGRWEPGILPRRNKLNFSQAQEIKKLSHQGLTRKQLEKKYSVSQTCIAKILTGVSWKKDCTLETQEL